jgi:serine/threonine protein kinase
LANDPHFFAESASGGESSGELSLVPGILLGNKYRLLRPVGFGGMGAVWVARNEATAAEVAVKVLVTAREGVDQEAIARFRREAHTAAQLYHRGIVRIFDLVELSFANDPWREEFDLVATQPGVIEKRVPDALVLVMELLRGETLASHMDKKRRFSQEETLAIVLPLLSALAHAHAQGIVHRDLKPENVFLSVDPDGHVIPKILDFGISKLLQPAAPKITTDGAMLGTPSYMSPEQARGLSNVDARADVFAAGILLYECIAGENPFASGSYHSVVAAILEREPQELTTVSPEVWRVIRRALEKTAALRYADAGELAGALTNAAQRAGVETPDTSGAYPARPPAISEQSVPPPFAVPLRTPEVTMPSMRVAAERRARMRTMLGGLAVAAVLAAGAGFYLRSSRPVAPVARPEAASPAGAPSTSAPPVLPPSSAVAVPAPRAVEVAAPPASPLRSAVAPSGAPPSGAPPSGATDVPDNTPSLPDPAAVLHPHPRQPPTIRPKAPAAPPDPSTSSEPRSNVVRDPGF